MPGTWDNMPLLGSVSGELWGFQAKAGLVHSNQECGFSEPHGDLFKGCARRRPWEPGQTIDHKVVREVISGTQLLVTLPAAI